MSTWRRRELSARRPDISQWAGGLLLAGYTVVFAAIALTTSVQRDIT